MDILISMLVAVHVVVCLLLVIIVLMQRPKQEGLGAAFGGGMTDQMFGAQTTDVLQKGTVWLSVMFFAITMVLAILVSKKNNTASALSESLGTSDVPAAVESSGLPELPKGEQTLTVPPTAAKPAADADSGAAAVEIPAKKDDAPAKKDDAPAKKERAAGKKKDEAKADSGESAPKPKGGADAAGSKAGGDGG